MRERKWVSQLWYFDWTSDLNMEMRGERGNQLEILISTGNWKSFLLQQFCKVHNLHSFENTATSTMWRLTRKKIKRRKVAGNEKSRIHYKPKRTFTRLNKFFKGNSAEITSSQFHQTFFFSNFSLNNLKQNSSILVRDSLTHISTFQTHDHNSSYFPPSKLLKILFTNSARCNCMIPTLIFSSFPP